MFALLSRDFFTYTNFQRSLMVSVGLKQECE